ncbi:MAG: long-chain-fatty-acid--CoA ligase [Elusimicrobia bacterium]|nr:long-chain-fatty-acid--CoA ligase [Elusimicrobiota bacterium]
MTLNDLLDEAARRAPQGPALVTPEETLSFSELQRRVLFVAAGFSARGIGKNDAVAIVHRNSPVFVISYFALARLGAVAVPINFMVQKPDELAYMLNDCQAKGIVTQSEFLKGLRGAAAKARSVAMIWVSDPIADEKGERPREEPFSNLLQEPAALSYPQAQDQDTVAILYTSGTTGNPKGVMLTHRNLASNAVAGVKKLAIRPNDVQLALLPMFHIFGWTANVLVSLLARTKLVISPSITPPRPWLGLMAKHGVTMFSAVPQLFSILAKQATGLQGLVLRYWFFRKVRLAVSGAAPLSPVVLEAFEKNLRVPIVEGYGLTETAPIISVNPVEKRKPGSVGTMIDGVKVRIIDDQEHDLELGQEGEICVKGDNVMKGYYNLPQATREAFTTDGWFKTGDIGALDSEGYLYIRDRKKDMIIIKGLKVFSAQVESVMLEHPDVQEAALIGIPDEHGDETIKAFVVLKKGASTDKSGLMQFCRSKLDPYKRPRDIEIVEALPKNALQKVLKRALRQRELDKRTAAPPSSGPA